MQLQLGHEWEKKYQRLSPQRNSDGLITVGKRLSEWFGLSWNQNELILLQYEHRYTYVHVLMIHCMDHSVDSTIARVRSKFWLLKLTQLVRKIKSCCIVCKKNDKRRLTLEMGPLPLERMLPSAPFFNTGFDLFGSLTIKDTVKRRSRGKVYGVVYNCLVSRAVYVGIADGYHTDTFLLCFHG